MKKKQDAADVEVKRQSVLKSIRAVKNWPQDGILFQDLMPVLYDGKLSELTELLCLQMGDLQFDTVLAIEARGFIFGSALAERLNKKLVIARKPGKLAPPVQEISYTLEYGTDTLQMHKGSGQCLIVDDVLATGGTLRAAADLATQSGFTVIGFLTVINLKELNNFSWNQKSALSVFDF